MKKLTEQADQDDDAFFKLRKVCEDPSTPRKSRAHWKLRCINVIPMLYFLLVMFHVTFWESCPNLNI